jgi:hypothetical protein
VPQSLSRLRLAFLLILKPVDDECVRELPSQKYRHLWIIQQY